MVERRKRTGDRQRNERLGGKTNLHGNPINWKGNGSTDNMRTNNNDTLIIERRPGCKLTIGITNYTTTETERHISNNRGRQRPKCIQTGEGNRKRKKPIVNIFITHTGTRRCLHIDIRNNSL